MHFSSHSNRDRCELCVHQECPCNRTLWDSLRQHPSQFLFHSSCSFYHLNVAACANCTLWGELHCHMLILYIQYILQSTGGRRAAQQVINKVGSSFRMAMTGSHIKGFFLFQCHKSVLCQREPGVGSIWKINLMNTHHIVQADAPPFKQNLTREAIDKGKPDLE